MPIADYESLFSEGGGGPMDLHDIYSHCIVPTVQQVGPMVGGLVGWCVMFRVLTQGAAGKINSLMLNARDSFYKSHHFYHISNKEVL